MCDYANGSTYLIRAVSSDVNASKNINSVCVCVCTLCSCAWSLRNCVSGHLFGENVLFWDVHVFCVHVLPLMWFTRTTRWNGFTWHLSRYSHCIPPVVCFCLHVGQTHMHKTCLHTHYDCSVFAELSWLSDYYAMFYRSKYSISYDWRSYIR